jgi:hypothetical protein
MGTVGYPNAPSSAPKAVATCFCDPSATTVQELINPTLALSKFIPKAIASATVSDNLTVILMVYLQNNPGYFTMPDPQTWFSGSREVSRCDIVASSSSLLSNNRTSASAFILMKVGGPEIV